uniref:Uncharacterized protein n=1 Tax=Oryza nivara TaxID=4536 RepID=A0A0E0FVI8_ORYNI
MLRMVSFHYGEDVFQISYHGGSLLCPWAAHQLFDEMHGRGALMLLFESLLLSHIYSILHYML